MEVNPFPVIAAERDLLQIMTVAAAAIASEALP